MPARPKPNLLVIVHSITTTIHQQPASRPRRQPLPTSKNQSPTQSLQANPSCPCIAPLLPHALVSTLPAPPPPTAIPKGSRRSHCPRRSVSDSDFPAGHFLFSPSYACPCAFRFTASGLEFPGPSKGTTSPASGPEKTHLDDPEARMVEYLLVGCAGISPHTHTRSPFFALTCYALLVGDLG